MLSAIWKKHKHLLVFTVILTAVLVVRAALEGASYDEAWSWGAVRSADLAGIVTYRDFAHANNHLLNSLWIALLQWVGTETGETLETLKNVGDHWRCSEILE